MPNIPSDSLSAQRVGHIPTPTSTADVDGSRTARARQCRRWNAKRDHQVMAGKARAAQFTREHQSTAGLASQAAHFARFRAGHGSPPLCAEWVRDYVTPAMIHGPLSQPPPEPLQRIIFDTWLAGVPYVVSYWLFQPQEGEDNAPLSPGSLFEPPEALSAHVWEEREAGWFVCAGCALAATCPGCAPTTWDIPLLAHLPPICCARHAPHRC
jgi:hypothetical protein